MRYLKFLKLIKALLFNFIKKLNLKFKSVVFRSIGLKDFLNDYNNFPLIISVMEKLTIEKQINFLVEDGSTWLVLPNEIKLKYLDKFNSVSSIIISEGNFENIELQIVSNNLKENSVFFDIGANIGFYSLSLAKMFNNIKIHAFEPVKETFLDLESNISKNNISNKIIVNNVAVGDVNGNVFITNEYHSSNYLVNASSTQHKEEVKLITIDSYIKDNSIDKIDFIKIDVEGRELLVLKGANESLRIFKPFILVELFEKPSNFMDRFVDDYKESISYLLGMNYEYYIIDDNGSLVNMYNIKQAKLLNSFHNYFFYHKDNKIKQV